MKIFLDDVRVPLDNTWTEFKDPYDCIDCVRDNIDSITHISFDHDLWYVNDFGEEISWYDVLTWVLEFYYSRCKQLPIITLHTANPVWKKNMEDQIKSYALYYKKTHA